MKNSDFFTIAQLSDIHLRMDGRTFNNAADTHETLSLCLRHVVKQELGVDLLLVTGDLADYPDPRAYSYIREKLDQIKLPYLIIPGNHDDRLMVYEVFKDLGYYPNDHSFIHFVSDDYPLRFIALDTLDPATGGAKMCETRLNWIYSRLKEQQNKPTIIFMHHTPFLTRMPFDSKHAFPGAGELEAIVTQFRNVQGVFCGHLHRPIFSRWGGTIAVVAPSITMQRTLTPDNGMPKATIREPVSFPLYLWKQGSEVICHLSFIGSFGDPFPLIKAPPL